MGLLAWNPNGCTSQTLQDSRGANSIGWKEFSHLKFEKLGRKSFSSMRKRGESQSKGKTAPISWPNGAWAHLQIKRPIENATERYLFKDELKIGRGPSLEGDDFRIDLKQVIADSFTCSLRAIS